MPALENIFSWSKSRDEEFKECRRKYYYSRYQSWGGWDARSPKEVRLAYILKNLKNRWAWKGETVHHVIEEVLKSLRSGRQMKKDEALARLTDIMRRDYRASKAKKYMEDPKKNLGLFEHEYQKDISDATWKKIHEEAFACLSYFYDSSLYQELLEEAKEEWLVIEDLEEFDFEGAKIYVKLDFARKKNGNVEIFDWKTGKDSGDTTVQIGAYAIYAMNKWKMPLDRLKAFLFYVSTPSSVPQGVALSQALLEETKKTMAESIASMQELLSDRQKNIPKSKEHFPFTSNEKLCSNCSFYKICEKYH